MKPIFTDYYSLLHISELATPDEIIKAYKGESLRWHPDRNPGIDTKIKMQDINEAKRILLQKELRDEYNLEYRQYKQASATGLKNKQNSHAGSMKEKGRYILSGKTDDQLLKTCANAARFTFEYIHAVLTELKTRNYTLETINNLIRQKMKSQN